MLDHPRRFIRRPRNGFVFVPLALLLMSTSLRAQERPNREEPAQPPISIRRLLRSRRRGWNDRRSWRR